MKPRLHVQSGPSSKVPPTVHDLFLFFEIYCYVEYHLYEGALSPCHARNNFVFAPESTVQFLHYLGHQQAKVVTPAQF